MVDVEQAARLRSVLLQGHDCLTVTLQSLERIIALIEQTWPQLGTSGRISAPAGTDAAHAVTPNCVLQTTADVDDERDDDDRDDREPSAGELAASLAAAVQALRALQPPPSVPVFPLNTAQLRALLDRYDPEGKTK
jgi:hypothetical protein